MDDKYNDRVKKKQIRTDKKNRTVSMKITNEGWFRNVQTKKNRRAFLLESPHDPSALNIRIPAVATIRRAARQYKRRRRRTGSLAIIGRIRD